MDRHDEIFKRLAALGWTQETRWMGATGEPYELSVSPLDNGSIAYFYDHQSWSFATADGQLACPTEEQILALLDELERLTQEAKNDGDSADN